MIISFLKLLLTLIMMIVFEITLIFCLWLLRIAIDWWLDIDYVEKLKKWVNKND